MRHHLITLMAICALSLGAHGQHRDSLLTAGLFVQVDDTPIYLGGCPRDTMKTTLTVDGRVVDPNSVEGRRYLDVVEREKHTDMATEIMNLDALLVQWNDQLMSTLPDEGTRNACALEFDRWRSARDSFCGTIHEHMSRDAQLAVLDCRRWITICRIEYIPPCYTNPMEQK